MQITQPGATSSGSSQFDRRAPTVAHLIAAFIVRQGIDRVYSLPGGHMKPIWDELSFAGVRIVTARHECAAVEMAQADADLTRRLAVAIVTTGPGLTNAITGIASAFLARSSVLIISTRVSRQQSGMGALEEVKQAELVRPVCRYVDEIGDTRHVLIRLDAAATAALGNDGPAGPVYVDFSTDLLRQEVPTPYRNIDALAVRYAAPVRPNASAINDAATQIAASRRPLVLTGRGAAGAGEVIERFLAATGSLYLDTRESRGLIPLDHAAYVPAMRARASASADLLITLGRRLDFEVAYGSSAGFSASTSFLRIGRSSDELSHNRLGSVELRADVSLGLEALLAASAKPRDPDHAWHESMVSTNGQKVESMQRSMELEPAGLDGGIHPYRLLATVNRFVDDQTIGIVDGGDILSFARGGLRVRTYLDLGAFGCLGTGLPFAIAASLRYPSRRVIAVIGDGALGFNLAEIETAVREGAPILVIVANNSAWNIERHDQIANYGRRIVGTQLSQCAYNLVAQGLGAYGERVEDIEDLESALGRALNNLPALVDVVVTRDAVSPDTKSGLAQVPDYQAVKAWDAAERKLWIKPEEEAMAVVVHSVEGRPRPRGYSEATSAAGLACISGQLAAEEVLTRNGGFAEQFISAVQRFAEVVVAVGAKPEDVLLIRIYVTDMQAYHDGAREFGPAYKEALGGRYPATTLVQVTGLVDPRALVEIEGLASKQP